MTFQEYKSAYWAMPESYRVGDMPAQRDMYDAVDGFISDCAFGLVPKMEICPSSLDEHGLPMDYTETAHKWDEETGICDECGAEKITEDI